MIFNIYKPKNWTSFDVVAKLRRILGIKKIGHAGTLDPLAEGVLVVVTEKDTKKQDEYMHTKKEYIAEIALGLDSDSYDLGTPLRKHSIHINNLALNNYVGKFNQTVPSYSAVKVEGKRLYKQARKGTVDIEKLPTRQVEIYEIEKLDEYKKDFEDFSDVLVIRVRIVCSSGFYVRSFAHDIGGVLVGLWRTKLGNFDIKDSITLEDLEKQYKKD